MTTDRPRPARPLARHHVSDYFRLERWEVPPGPGGDGFSEFGGRAPVDDHQRGPGGGLRAGGLVTVIDSLGGITCGLTVQPKWIVTTSLLCTFPRLDHSGPLRLDATVFRRGRNSVVAGLVVFDEGAEDARVAAATQTCAVLDPGAMKLTFDRPIVHPMPRAEANPPEVEEFFCIEPGTGPTTRMELADHLRNPWGILHGGAVAVMVDVAASRCVASATGRVGGVAAGDTAIHYLRPIKTGPVEARCTVVGTYGGRTVVRVAVHDVGSDDRVTSIASVSVVDV